MRRTTWAWVTPGAFLAAALLAGCGGGGGGGGSSSGGSGGGGGQTSSLALTATPEHGYIALSWNAPSDATGATTYSLSRETAGGSTFVTPVNYNGAASGLSSATLSFNDYPTGASGANAADPAVGTSYVYKLTATTGTTVETANQTASVSPLGPSTAQGNQIAESDGSANPNNEPYNTSVNSSVGLSFNYTITHEAPSSPSLTITAVTDYSLSAADLQNVKITIDGNTSVVYTYAQLGSAASYNSSTKTIAITLNGGSLPSGVTLPVVVPGGLLTANIYVPKASGSATLTIVEVTDKLPAVGLSASNSGSVGSAPVHFGLSDQSS